MIDNKIFAKFNLLQKYIFRSKLSREDIFSYQGIDAVYSNNVVKHSFKMASLAIKSQKSTFWPQMMMTVAHLEQNRSVCLC